MNKALGLAAVGLIAVGLAVGLPVLSWLSPLVYTLVFPVGAIWLWRQDERALRDLGFRWDKGWGHLLLGGLLCGLAFTVLLQIIQNLSGWVSLVARADPLNGLPIYLLSVMAKMVFIVGIEEFVFRGYFLQSFSQGLGRWPAILASSTLWALGHLTAMVTAGLSPILIGIGLMTFVIWGITLCLGYLQTDRLLWLPIGLHYGVNVSFSLIGWFVVLQYNAPEWWIGHSAWAPESGLIGVAGWGMMAFVIAWVTSATRNKKSTISSV